MPHGKVSNASPVRSHKSHSQYAPGRVILRECVCICVFICVHVCVRILLTGQLEQDGPFTYADQIHACSVYVNTQATDTSYNKKKHSLSRLSLMFQIPGQRRTLNSSSLTIKQIPGIPTDLLLQQIIGFFPDTTLHTISYNQVPYRATHATTTSCDIWLPVPHQLKERL